MAGKKKSRPHRPGRRGDDGATGAVRQASTATAAPGSGESAAPPDGHVPIVLEPVITIAEAAALKSRLLPYVGHGGEIVMDGSRVESVDSAALQVLLAFVRSARAHGAVIHWSGISETLLNTAQLLGLARLLSLQS